MGKDKPTSDSLTAGMSGRERIIAMVILAVVGGGAGVGGGTLFGGDRGKAAAVASAKIEAKIEALEVKIDAIDARLILTDKKNARIASGVSYIAGKLGMAPPEGSP